MAKEETYRQNAAASVEHAHRAGPGADKARLWHSLKRGWTWPIMQAASRGVSLGESIRYFGKSSARRSIFDGRVKAATCAHPQNLGGPSAPDHTVPGRDFLRIAPFGVRESPWSRPPRSSIDMRPR
jgi:hypothetical protein